MEQDITELLNKVNLRYGVQIESKHTLGNSANLIYEIDLQGTPAILRISRYSEHKEMHVAFELAWMSELT